MQDGDCCRQGLHDPVLEHGEHQYFTGGRGFSHLLARRTSMPPALRRKSADGYRGPLLKPLDIGWDAGGSAMAVVSGVVRAERRVAPTPRFDMSICHSQHAAPVVVGSRAMKVGGSSHFEAKLRHAEAGPIDIQKCQETGGTGAL